jgi:hypothetical protein
MGTVVFLSVFLSTTADGRWHPAIGDPTLMGWVTVAAYLVAALLAFRRARAARVDAREPNHDAARGSAERALARFWAAVALLLLALGVNKQLDLQTLFTQIGRDLAHAQGWYEERRRFQVMFIACVGVLSLLGTLGLAIALRKIATRIWLALLGVGFLVSFVLIRAASFHHVDLLLHAGTVRLNWVFELTGIGLIAAAAARSNGARSAQPSQSTTT